MNDETKSKSNFAPPTKRDVLRAIASFSKTEKAVFWIIAALSIIFALATIQGVSRFFMVEVPTYGGSFVEGIVGTPRFINPVLAISEADRDGTMLVYSGLLRKTAGGELVPDLASKYDISKDGLTYTFTLRDNIFFHDGAPVTTDDIEFTILKAKDPTIKSPKRPDWEGVSVQKIDGKTISFILKQPYVQFLENTTIGILPKNLWKEVPTEQFSFSDLNLKGIGSGPYAVDAVTKNSGGIPVSISFSSFKKFALGKPYVSFIDFNFYNNEEELLSGLKSGSVDNINAIMPEEAKNLKDRGIAIRKYALPRVYGVFFNQSSAPVFTDKSVREALNEAIDRKKIVDSVLYGYGTPIYGPIPERMDESLSQTEEKEKQEELSERAKKILGNSGWKIDESDGVMKKKSKKETSILSFSISTADKPELRAVAMMLKEDWEKIGARVEIKIFELGDFNQNIIRPRKYDSMLFGEVISKDSDPYAFWHSSQRNDPGLNIALYANSKVDKILESARVTLDTKERAKKYAQFEDAIKEDIPAVFIYSPDFIYVMSPGLSGVEIGELNVPAERFLNVYKWYKETDFIWKLFN